jgi:competence protein ComEC
MRRAVCIGLSFVLQGIISAGISPCCRTEISTQASAAERNLEVHIIDVSQGDSFFIRSPSGMTVLLDAGNTGFGTEIVLPYLRGLGITSIDYIVASHYHMDHIGGLDEVVNGLGGQAQITKAAYDRGGTYRAKSFTEYISSIGDKRKTILPGQTIDLGDTVTIRCIAANGYIPTGRVYEGIDENALSVVLVLGYRHFQMYFGGDSNFTVEPFLAPFAGDVDVYKVSHHGSATSSTQGLLDFLKPEVSIITLGGGFPYKIPHYETLSRLININSYIYMTHTGSNLPPAGKGQIANGAFKITTDGHSYIISGSSLMTITRMTDEEISRKNSLTFDTPYRENRLQIPCGAIAFQNR